MIDRLTGLAAVPVLLGAILLVHWPRWSFVSDSHRSGRHGFQVPVAGVALYLLLVRGAVSDAARPVTMARVSAAAVYRCGRRASLRPGFRIGATNEGVFSIWRAWQNRISICLRLKRWWTTGRPTGHGGQERQAHVGDAGIVVTNKVVLDDAVLPTAPSKADLPDRHRL